MTELGSAVTPASRPLAAWAKSNPVAVATVFGGLIYVAVSESYRAALLPLGVRPDELGISYLDIVWPVAQSLSFLAIGFGIPLLLITQSRLHLKLAWRPIAAASAFIIVVVVSALALAEESRYGKSIDAGQPYVPVLTQRLQVLKSLRADRVKVIWKDSTNGKVPLVPSDVLYLGSANGVSVFYATAERLTVRIPSSDIVIFQPRKTEASGGRKIATH